MLTLLGGLIGIGLGYGGAYIVSTFAKWPPLVSWEVVVGGVLFSMTLGIIFGLIPANKAAKLDQLKHCVMSSVVDITVLVGGS